jgi:hypothetical protein
MRYCKTLEDFRLSYGQRAHRHVYFPYRTVKKTIRRNVMLPASYLFANMLRLEMDRCNDHAISSGLKLQQLAERTLAGTPGYCELVRITTSAAALMTFGALLSIRTHSTCTCTCACRAKRGPILLVTVEVNCRALRKTAKKYDKRLAGDCVLGSAAFAGLRIQPTQQEIVLRWLQCAPFTAELPSQMFALFSRVRRCCPPAKVQLLEKILNAQDEWCADAEFEAMHRLHGSLVARKGTRSGQRPHPFTRSPTIQIARVRSPLVIACQAGGAVNCFVH